MIRPSKESSMTESASSNDTLCLIWTNADPDAARNMVFMYGGNSLRNGWWEHVRIMVWGPSAKLLAQDQSLQADVAALMRDGVEVCACKSCADNFGVSDKLRELGIDVRYTGKELTGLLKDGVSVLTV